MMNFDLKITKGTEVLVNVSITAAMNYENKNRD